MSYASMRETIRSRYSGINLIKVDKYFPPPYYRGRSISRASSSPLFFSFFFFFSPVHAQPCLLPFASTKIPITSDLPPARAVLASSVSLFRLAPLDHCKGASRLYVPSRGSDPIGDTGSGLLSGSLSCLTHFLLL